MDKKSQALLQQATDLESGLVTFEDLFLVYNKLMAHEWHCVSCNATGMLLIVGACESLVLDCISRGVCPDPRKASGWASGITEAASKRLSELSGGIREQLEALFSDPEALAAAMADGSVIPLWDGGPDSDEFDPLDVN